MDLIDEFHWTPQEISKIPYKKLQILFLTRKHKNNAIESKRSLEEFKNKEKLKRKGK